MNRAVWTLTVASLLFGSAFEASAYVDPPRFEPAVPRAGEPVTLVVHAGFCHAFVGSATRPTVTLDGMDIELIVLGVHEYDVHCIFGLAGEDYRFKLGAFPAGDYTVTMRMEHFADAEWEYELLADKVPLKIVSAKPFGIPAASTIALAMLSLLVAIGSAWHLRRR